MMSCGTILCAVPATCWGREQAANRPGELLRRFFRELDTLERRLKKRIAFDDECARYSRLCGQIEQVALGNSVYAPTGWRFRRAIGEGRFPAVRVGSEYVDLLRLLHAQGRELGIADGGRLGASVFSPRQLPEHVRSFRRAAEVHQYLHYAPVRHRLWFINKRLVPAHCGLVEIPDALSRMAHDDVVQRGAVDGRSLWERLLARLFPSPPPERSGQQRREELVGGVETRTVGGDWQEYGVEDRGDFMTSRLRRQIEQALSGNGIVNLMNQRQNMATEILQEYIHGRTDKPPVEARVTYADGGMVRPFPLCCLPRLPDGWTPTREFHFGLVSMRHLHIDQYIDMNWYRNVEVPSGNGLAAADEACFQFSMKQLAELLAAHRGQRLRLHIYHTGYMPAVIGFYRALVTTLVAPTPPTGCLQVLPKLQPDREGGFVEGKPWPE